MTNTPDSSHGGNASFISEHGAHAGASEAEMQTFVIGPAGVTHPAQLYAHFMCYQLA